MKKRIILEKIAVEDLPTSYPIRKYHIKKKNFLSNEYFLIGIAVIVNNSYSIEAVQHIRANELMHIREQILDLI